MTITNCRYCYGRVTHVPEYDVPPIGQYCCDDCGDYTSYCLSCLLMTDDHGHVCYVQTKLM